MVVANRPPELPIMPFVFQLGALWDGVTRILSISSMHPSIRTYHVSGENRITYVATHETPITGLAGNYGVIHRVRRDPCGVSTILFHVMPMIRGVPTIQSCCSICGVGLVDSASFWFSPLIIANIRLNPANAISSYRLHISSAMRSTSA